MNPTARFSDRVADYVKYRPSYPPEAIDAIISKTHLTKGARIADVGSGTGISARCFVERGFEVIGIEPNKEMREAAEAHGAQRREPLLGGRGGEAPREAREVTSRGFRSIDGTAEHTGLEESSVALALAAQAFHWFRRDQARLELRRITTPPHSVVLMWNERLTDTAFLRDYEAALHAHAIDYAEVNHANIERAELSAFLTGGLETLTFPNAQSFDHAGFIGRALSSSYVPRAGHAKHEAMMKALEDTFAKHALDGRVEFRYLTSVHVGTV